MTQPALEMLLQPGRVTARQYLRLIDEGVLGPDDRVELLEGVVVSMAPSGPRHAAAVTRLTKILVQAIGDRAVVRPQLTFVAGRKSVPEPDIAVLPGTLDDYDRVHPSEALLAIEASDSSLAQDRITKAVIYAAAGIPEYWIVNLRDDVIEVYQNPDRRRRLYRDRSRALPGDVVAPAAMPDVRIAVRDVLPRR